MIPTLERILLGLEADLCRLPTENARTKKIKHLTSAALILGASTAQAIPIQWTSGAGANGNWYELVSTPVNWTTARSQALASSWQGGAGHLATLISAEENLFVSAIVAQGALAWVGGSDEWNSNNDKAEEGKWKWMDGPEAGQMFWNSGTPQLCASWNPGEPNHAGSGEDSLQINWGALGGWNDHDGPGNSAQLNGYVVEYTGAASPAAIPEPGTLALAAAALVGLGWVRRRRS